MASIPSAASVPKDHERNRRVRLRWGFIALLVVGGVVNYLDRGTLSVGNTTIAKDLGLNTAQMGLLLSAFAWPYALANLPAGYSSTSSGPRPCTRGPRRCGPSSRC